MLFNILVLLLSYSTTSTRNKSILYSRTTITVLIISMLIVYDNLSLLFLAEEKGTFGMALQTATTNSFHIIIFFYKKCFVIFTSNTAISPFTKEIFYTSKFDGGIIINRALFALYENYSDFFKD